MIVQIYPGKNPKNLSLILDQVRSISRVNLLMGTAVTAICVFFRPFNAPKTVNAHTDLNDCPNLPGKKS